MSSQGAETSITPWGLSMGAVSTTPKLTTHELIAQALNRRRQRPGAIPLVDSLTIAREVMAQLDPEDYKAALEEVLPEFIRTTMVHANRSLGPKELVPNAARPKSRLNRSPGS